MSANIREDMVEMAVRFLANPTVSTSSKFTKKQFLSKKGLSVEEIAAAFSMMQQQQHPLGRNSIRTLLKTSPKCFENVALHQNMTISVVKAYLPFKFDSCDNFRDLFFSVFNFTPGASSWTLAKSQRWHRLFGAIGRNSQRTSRHLEVAGQR